MVWYLKQKDWILWIFLWPVLSWILSFTLPWCELKQGCILIGKQTYHGLERGFFFLALCASLWSFWRPRVNIRDGSLIADKNITIRFVNIRSSAQKSKALLRNCLLRDPHVVLVHNPVSSSEARLGAKKICLFWGRLRESGHTVIVYEVFAWANIVNESLLAEFWANLKKKLVITYYVIWSTLLITNFNFGPCRESQCHKCSNFDFDSCRESQHGFIIQRLHSITSLIENECDLCQKIELTATALLSW